MQVGLVAWRSGLWLWPHLAPLSSQLAVAIATVACLNSATDSASARASLLTISLEASLESLGSASSGNASSGFCSIIVERLHAVGHCWQFAHLCLLCRYLFAFRFTFACHLLCPRCPIPPYPRSSAAWPFCWALNFWLALPRNQQISQQTQTRSKRALTCTMCCFFFFIVADTSGLKKLI